MSLEIILEARSFQVPGQSGMALGHWKPWIPRYQGKTIDEWETILHSSKSDQEREKAAFALAEFGAAGVPSLIKALKDDDQVVGYWAQNALGKVGPAAFPSLIEALKHKSWRVRSGAATAIGEIRSEASEDAVSALIEALEDEDILVVSCAEAALYQVGAKAIPSLITAFKTNKGPARAAAKRAILSICKHRAERFDVSGAPGNYDIIGPIHKTAVPTMIEALKDKDSEVRKTSADAIRLLGPDAKSALPTLKALSKNDPVPSVREAAATAIRGIQGE